MNPQPQKSDANPGTRVDMEEPADVLERTIIRWTWRIAITIVAAGAVIAAAILVAFA